MGTASRRAAQDLFEQHDTLSVRTSFNSAVNDERLKGPLQARGRLQHVLRLDSFAVLHIWVRQRFASQQTFLPPGVNVANFFRQLTASLATNIYPHAQFTLSKPAPWVVPAVAHYRPRRDATLPWADSSGAKATITLIGQQMETVCRNHVCLNHAKRTKSWARAIVSGVLQSQGQDLGFRVVHRVAAALADALLNNQQYLPAWGLRGVSAASRIQLQVFLDAARHTYAPLLPATDQRLEADWHLYLPWQGAMLEDLEAFQSTGGRCKGVKTWDPLPRPTMKFPHILVDNAVLFELLREAHYTLPAQGPGSVDDQAQGWWPRAFHIERVTTSGHAFGLHINTGAYTQIKRASLSTDCVSVDFHLFRPKLPAPAPAQPSPEVASTSSAASPSARAVPTPPRPGASKFTWTGSRRKKKKVDRTKGLAGARRLGMDDYRVIIGVDPGRRDFFTAAVRFPGQPGRDTQRHLSTTTFRIWAGYQRNADKMQQLLASAGLAELVNSQPSTHTMSLATLDTHMARFAGGAKTLKHVVQFHQRSTVRRQRFEAYIRRQRALHRAAQYLVGEGMDPAFVLILFGDARFSSSSPGFGSAPVRWFRLLPAYGHTLETCEFRTSITCSACLRPTQHACLPASISELEELPVGQRRVLNKNVQVCTSCHINWNRDFNAARNILTVGLSQLDPTGHPKPARFQR